MLFAANCAPKASASAAFMPVIKGLKSGVPIIRTNNASTATVTIVAPINMRRCVRESPATKLVTCFCTWFIDGMLLAMASYSFALELQFRNFLVRVHDLVPHLHHELKCDVGLFHGDHDVVDVLPVALYQLTYLLVGRML